MHAPAVQCWKVPAVGGQSSSLWHAWATHKPPSQCCGAPLDAGQSLSCAHEKRHTRSGEQRSRGLTAWQSPSAWHGLWVQMPHCFVQTASCWQSEPDPHCGVQKPLPAVSITQCWVVASAVSKQSWSVWQGAQ